MAVAEGDVRDDERAWTAHRVLAASPPIQKREWVIQDTRNTGGSIGFSAVAAGNIAALSAAMLSLLTLSPPAALLLLFTADAAPTSAQPSHEPSHQPSHQPSQPSSDPLDFDGPIPSHTPCYAVAPPPVVAFDDPNMDAITCINQCPLVAFIAPTGPPQWSFNCACAVSLVNATSVDANACTILCPLYSAPAADGGDSPTSAVLTTTTAPAAAVQSSVSMDQGIILQNPATIPGSTSSSSSSASALSPAVIGGIAGAAVLAVIGMAVGIQQRSKRHNQGKVDKDATDFGFYPEFQVDKRLQQSSVQFPTLPSSLGDPSADHNSEIIATVQLPPLKSIDNPTASLPTNLRKYTINSYASANSRISEASSLTSTMAGSEETGSGRTPEDVNQITIGLGAMPDNLRRKFDDPYSPTITNSDMSLKAVISGRDSVKSLESGASSIFMNGLQKNLERCAENKAPECRPEALAEISVLSRTFWSMPLGERETASRATTPTVVGSSSTAGISSAPSLIGASVESRSVTRNNGMGGRLRRD
ncbi:hypothetical protein HDU82_007991 [Entophlyctis luteolus]|nr:hypothetical protein HDU82_007991 [Entophlyctis luteolus]